MAATVGFATLDVIPSVRGLRAQLDRQVTPGLAAAGRKGGKQFGDAAGATAAQGFSSKLQSGLNGMGGKLFAGLGLAAAGKAIIGLQADFESSINVLGASADLTSAQMRQMASFAKKMGAETVFSAGEAADAMVELAKAGLTPATIQAGALKATMAVAATEGLQLADAATIISNTMTTFGIEGSKAVQVADALAGGSKASTASVSSLSEAMSQVGGSAADAGLSLQETVAALAAFDQGGIKGSDAGTSLKTMLSRLVPQTDRAKNAMDDLGLSFTDASGQFLPLSNIAGQLQKSMSGLSDAERTTALNTIFGSDARRAAIVLMNEGKEGIDKFTRATSEAGTASKLANARMSGTAGAIEKMRGSIEGLGLVIGETVAPAVVVTADGIGTLADAISAIPAPVKAAALAFGALKIASSFGLTPQGGVTSLTKGVDNLRTRATWAKAAFDNARGSVFQFGATSSGVASGQVGRLSASMTALRAASMGVGTGIKRGLGSAMNMVGGPWAIALGVGVGALVKFKQGQAEAKAKIDATTAALDEQTGAITKQNEDLAFNALKQKGVIDLAEKYGLSLDDVRKAALGNEDASRRVNAELQRQAAAFQEVGKVASGGDSLVFAEDAQKIQAALGGETATLQASQREWKQRQDFHSGDDTSETITSGMRDYAGEIEKARDSLQGLVDAEKKRAENALKQKGDELGLVVALQEARKEAREGAKTLDITTKAGQENRQELYALAQQWQSSGDKVKNAKGAYVDMRQNFIDVAREMGATKKQAENLADKLLDVPKSAPVKFQSEGYKERLREIQELRRQMRALREVANLNYGSKPKAPNLTPGYATGGKIGGFGTGTSDSNLIRASRNEWMIQERSASYYGDAMMAAINNRTFPKIPGYATGGKVTDVAPASSGGAGLVIDQRGSTFQVADYRDFMQQMERRSQASNLSGVRS